MRLRKLIDLHRGIGVAADAAHFLRLLSLVDASEAGQMSGWDDPATGASARAAAVDHRSADEARHSLAPESFEVVLAPDLGMGSTLEQPVLGTVTGELGVVSSMGAPVY